MAVIPAGVKQMKEIFAHTSISGWDGEELERAT